MNLKTHSRTHRGLVWLAVGVASLGIGFGAASMVSAAGSGSGSGSTTSDTVLISSTSGTDSTNGTDSSSTPLAPPAGQADPSTLPNGPGETVLTGDTAAKVTAAAEAAEPGSTVIRVETDSDGHAYEAHVKLADGSVKTLYFTDTFAADGSDLGFGAGQPPAGQDGQHGPHGQPPADQTADTTAASNG